MSMNSSKSAVTHRPERERRRNKKGRDVGRTRMSTGEMIELSG